MRLGRPRKFESPEELVQAINEYFDERDKTELPYTVESLAVALDMDRKTLLNYEKREGYEEFFHTIKKAKNIIQSSQFDAALTAKNPTFFIFSFKNNFAYEEKQEVAVSQLKIEF